ncbi:MAG: hypothetical protein O3A46_09380, partial [Candidatus Poribacteria bacterium]|nr:hypothetical protein [Candidatus Poribacteria bacterium]
MRRFGVRVLSIIAATCLIAAGVFGFTRVRALHDAPAVAASPIRVGEELVYDVSLWSIGAGSQTLRVTEATTHDGVATWRLQSEASPSSMLSRLYHFRDFTESL